MKKNSLIFHKYLFATTFSLVSGINSAYAITINSTVPDVSISGTNQEAIVVDGGVVEGNIDGSGFNHDITLDSGIVQGDIQFNGFEHTFNFLNGEFLGNLEFTGFDHIVNISGGELEGGTSGSGNRHIVNIFGSGLSSTRPVGTPISGNSTIIGFLSDGNDFNYNISIVGNYTVNLFNTSTVVPEAGTVLAIFTVGGLGLGMKGKKDKIRKKL